MSEELKEDVVEEIVEDNEPEYTEEELQAIEHGWAPKETWDGDPEDWVSARTFNKRGELFGKIKSLERDMKRQQQEFKQAATATVDMLKKARETEYNRAVANLKKQKREAAEDGDSNTILDIDDRIEELSNDHSREMQELNSTATAPNVPSVPPEFEEWSSKNPWYSTDGEMQITADAVGLQYAQRNPNATLTEVYKEVEKQIKKIYPDKFSPSKRAPKVTESTSRTPSKRTKSKYSERDLTDDQRSIMNTMVKSGVMSKEDYIEELAKIGEIGG